MDEQTERKPGAGFEKEIGFAIASLVLGIMAATLSILVVGAILGLVGIGLGIAQLRRGGGFRGMAWWGIGLSIFGTLGGLLMGTAVTLMILSMLGALPGAEETDEDQVKMWEGVTAPDFTVTTLDGQTITLSQLKGKRVVVDCWATWCPPCRKEIPHFTQLAKEISADDLVIVGISDEEKQTVVDFTSKNEVGYAIAAANDLPAPYSEVNALPTTFCIDRNGVIQSVLVGYNDLETLRQAATGDDYAGPAKDKPEPAATAGLTEPEKPLTPSQAWSTPIRGGASICAGDWDGDGAEEFLVADGSDQLHVVGLDGSEKGTVPLPQAYSIIEMGRNRDSGPRLLGYDNWGQQVSVVGHEGRVLWTHQTASGVDGAHWVDLDGDGNDEMIIGMNGAGGIEAVTANGDSLWQSRLGNVWNQGVVSATESQPALVAATEAGGSIRLFDKDGHEKRTVRPERRYYTQLSAARMDSAGAIQIVAEGQDMHKDEGNRVVACDEAGTIVWSADSAGDAASWRNATFVSGDLNGDGVKEWTFLDAGTSLVVASAKGEHLASIPVKGEIGGYAVAGGPSAGARLAVLQDRKTLTAYGFE